MSKTSLLSLIIMLISGEFILSQGRYGNALSENSIVCTTSEKGYLYPGIDNYLKIDTSLYGRCDEIDLETSNGIVVKDTQNIYLIIPEKTGKLRLSVVCGEHTQGELQGYKYFHVQNVPDPLLTLNTEPISNPGLIARNTLLNCDSLGVYFNSDLIGSSEWFTITEFLLGYTYGGFYVSHRNPSNKLSMETKNIINCLGPDHEISIKPTVSTKGKIKKQLPIYRIRIY